MEKTNIKELSEWFTKLYRAYDKSQGREEHAVVEVWTYRDDDHNVQKLCNKLKEKNLEEFDGGEQRLLINFLRYEDNNDFLYSDSMCYPSPITVKTFLEWQKNIPEIKERWNTLQDLMAEINTYDKPKTMDDYINRVVDYINTHKKMHMHKPVNTYGNPFGMLKIPLDEEFFTLSSGEKQNKLMEIMPICLGMHNARAVFVIDDYAVGCSFEDLVSEKFTVYHTRKKRIVECNLTENEQERLCKALFVFVQDVYVKLIRRDIMPELITFEASTDPELPESISTKIKALWDDTLNGKDIRTNSSLTDGYMTMLGYLFSPINKAERICLSFYSNASGFGKTSFIKELCRRTDITYGQLACESKANQFTFSYVIATGPDILQSDDPMAGTDDILAKVSTLVSNHSSQCELKGCAVQTIERLYTKVLITSNVPLYMKKDQNNFITEKLFELRTNEMESCANDTRVADITHYIETCSEQEINNFLTKCINMYNDNPDWLKLHKGQYQGKDEIRCKFALVDPNKLCDTTNKTLLDCKYNKVVGYDDDHNHAIQEVQTQWAVMCKYIKTTLPKLADICKCSVPLESGIYSPTSMQPSSRFKNYTLNNELRTKIKEALGITCSERVPVAYTNTWDEIPPFDVNKHGTLDF